MKPGAELLLAAVGLLAPLGREVVFLGGATVHLHLDDPAAQPARSTRDVDVVVAVVNYAEYAEIEEKLRSIGFEQSLTDDSPICRWSKHGLLIDVMPTKPEYIGFSASPWFAEGFENARAFELAGGQRITAFDTLYLLAVKVDAFQDRGGGDLYSSQDFEDIATVLDGHINVWNLLISDAAPAVFVRRWLKAIDVSELTAAIAGHVNSYQRAQLLVGRIASLPE